uniref:Uncharacterized protein n=1 Tax=Arundo donax TaxID=35708 RepID=A0A0A9FG28_ARUDO
MCGCETEITKYLYISLWFVRVIKCVTAVMFLYYMITSSSCGLQLIYFKLYINAIQHFPKNMNQEYEKLQNQNLKA